MDESMVKLKLEKNLLYQELVRRSSEDTSINDVLVLVKKAGEYSFNISKSIIKYMPEYTLHDENHIFNMLH